MESMIQRAAGDVLESRYAVALTGAGVSTESGVADFRGPKGLWTTDRAAEARAYQRFELFLNDPKAYWQEMLGLTGSHGAFYAGLQRACPNAGHYALAELESLGVLKCVITQNVDGLHRRAGSKRVLEYHGSVERVRCFSCGMRRPRDEVCLDELPPRCQCGGVFKYDVVHFKEPIPADVMDESEDEVLRCDLMIIAGTSAVVYPFANLPRMVRMQVGRGAENLDADGRGRGLRIIEVNAERTPLTSEGISDYLIQGKTGELLPRIVSEVKKACS